MKIYTLTITLLLSALNLHAASSIGSASFGSATFGGTNAAAGAWADVLPSANVDTGQTDYLQSGTLTWTPITLSTGTATKLRIYVSTFVSACNVKLALCDSGKNVLQRSTNSVSSTGYVEATIPDQAVSAGTYYIAFIADPSDKLAPGYKVESVLLYYKTGWDYETGVATSPLPEETGSVSRSYPVGVYVQ